MKGLINRKILAIVCIIILIIILLSIFSPNNTAQTQKPIITIGKTESTNAKITPTNTLTTYYGNSYTVSYPNGWAKNERALSNNAGTVVNIQPSGTNLYSHSTITVEVLNAQNSSMVALTSILKLLKYTKTTSAIAGNAAQKYTAVLPTQNGSLHSIVYLFQKNDKIYSLKLEYIQSSVNQGLENQFGQIVSSFSSQ